jgi:YHS domain-containing protein
MFRNEAEYVKPGMKVKITLPQQKREFQATASAVLPQFDPTSRTLKVRLELDNPGYLLRPDMFVDVEFPVTLPPTLIVPSDALLDSGIKKTVFVDRGNGFFEPRQVETGWRLGDKVEITKGLMAGEQIVVSGNFLIDSESKMKMAAAGMHGRTDGLRTKDPVCGMEVDPKNSKGAGLFMEHDGKSYYFCMPECKQEFLKNTARYVDNKSEHQESRKTVHVSKGEKQPKQALKRTPTQESSYIHGHSMDLLEKPVAKEPTDMRETTGTPHQGMAPHD